jgi:hypothetical protein
MVYMSIAIWGHVSLYPMFFGWFVALFSSLTLDILDGLTKKEKE